MKSKRLDGPRIAREKTTIRHMITIYCTSLHQKKGKSEELPLVQPDSGLCLECTALRDYAMKRLTFCQFGEEKTTCVDCPVHCYAPQQREAIKQVMRYSGPKMLWRHPVLAIRHMLD